MRSCKVIAPRHNATKTLEFNEIEENSSCLEKVPENHTSEEAYCGANIFSETKDKHHYSSMHVEVWDIYKTACQF